MGKTKKFQTEESQKGKNRRKAMKYGSPKRDKHFKNIKHQFSGRDFDITDIEKEMDDYYDEE